MLLVCFEGLARLSRRVWRRFVRGSREISLVPSLHRASTDALYQCGGMGWGGATIGWAYSNSLYEKHPLSGFSNSSDIACEFSSNRSAIVYRLDRGRSLTVRFT